MAKRSLTREESFDLRQTLHVATLDALMASRRWAPGQLVFQGGTSLRLAHGSPRFSEDLNFLVSEPLDVSLVHQSVKDRLMLAIPSWLPTGMAISVGKSRDTRNPSSFVVSLKGDKILGAVRVKVELWKADKQAVADTGATVSAVRLASGLASGMQAFIPVATRPDIMADKVFALAARPYIKPRDVFDIWWLTKNGVLPRSVRVRDMRVRFATYPNKSVNGWVQKAVHRLREIPGQVAMIHADLQRWLPSAWPLDPDLTKEMIQASLAELRHGLDLVRSLQTPTEDDDAAPG